MNYNKRFVHILFVTIIVIAVETLVHAARDLQPYIPENDYVLRSCMSSVELSRRNVNSQKSKSHEFPHSPRKRTAVTSPATHHPIFRYPVKSVETKAREKSQEILAERILRRGRPARQMVADTPLTTLKVERRGRKNVPLLYVKKDLLPEIVSSVTDDRTDKMSEASIIVIESTPPRFSKQ